MTRIEVVAMSPAHWPAVERIYAAGIATGHATFETQPPTWEAFHSGKLPQRRLVALVADRLVGWAAVSAVSDRWVYAGVVEHSVYVDPAASGRGIGLQLLNALSDSTEAAGIWTIQSSSQRTPPASPSTAKPATAKSAPAAASVNDLADGRPVA